MCLVYQTEADEIWLLKVYKGTLHVQEEGRTIDVAIKRFRSSQKITKQVRRIGALWVIQVCMNECMPGTAVVIL